MALLARWAQATVTPTTLLAARRVVADNPNYFAGNINYVLRAANISFVDMTFHL